tara:strand:+ start:158 stop:436 length:279 start_codon:yes stop_codon:yes gene_type:complete
MKNNIKEDNKEMKRGDEFIVTYELPHIDEVRETTTIISSLDEKTINLRNGLSLPMGWIRNGIIKNNPLRVDLKESEFSISQSGSIKNSYTTY